MPRKTHLGILWWSNDRLNFLSSAFSLPQPLSVVCPPFTAKICCGLLLSATVIFPSLLFFCSGFCVFLSETPSAESPGHVSDNVRYFSRISGAYYRMELLLFTVLPLSRVSDKDTVLVAGVGRRALLHTTVTLVLFIWYSTGVEVSSSLRRLQVRFHSSALNL